MSYFLSGSDYVGVSFWLVYAAMIAATVFFFYEGFHVKKEWRLSLLVAGLVTLVAAIHYDYMRDYWVSSFVANDGIGESPIVYRYIDWLITVPLLMIEFYIILKAVGASVSANSFWRLLIGTLVMLIGGYLGETGLYGVGATFGFIIGMIGWAVIIWEIFRGEASQAADGKEGIKSAFNALRIIVLVGWAIYPIGYVLGVMMDGGEGNYAGTLNLIYNLADFVNKILFGLIIWGVATKEA